MASSLDKERAYPVRATQVRLMRPAHQSISSPPLSFLRLFERKIFPLRDASLKKETEVVVERLQQR